MTYTIFRLKRQHCSPVLILTGAWRNLEIGKVEAPAGIQGLKSRSIYLKLEGNGRQWIKYQSWITCELDTLTLILCLCIMSIWNVQDELTDASAKFHTLVDVNQCFCFLNQIKYSWDALFAWVLCLIVKIIIIRVTYPMIWLKQNHWQWPVGNQRDLKRKEREPPSRILFHRMAGTMLHVQCFYFSRDIG